jgi:ribosomal protein L24E
MLLRGVIVKMPKCVYCEKVYNFPKGLTLVKNDGSINHLCSSKCRKNMLMKRRKVHWILKKVGDKKVKKPVVKVDKKEVKKTDDKKE